MGLQKNPNIQAVRRFSFSFLFADAAREKHFLFEQLGLMLSSGIDIMDVLTSLEQEIDSRSVKKTLRSMIVDIDNGESVWRTLQKRRILPEHLINIIRIGEESGSLSESLRTAIEQRQKEAELRAKIRSASLYPVFVTVLMVIIGAVIAIFVLPRVSAVYANFNTELPVITKVIISLGSFFEKYGAIAVPVFVVFSFLMLYLIFAYKRTKFIGQWILLHTPYIRGLVIKIEVSRLGFFLGTLLDSGIPLNKSLDLLIASTSFKAYKKIYENLKAGIENGDLIKDIFKTNKSIKRYLPLFARQSIISAEKTGRLPKTLKQIGNTYEKQSETATKDLSTLLEPVLLIIVWIGVAFIAFAVILPIYSIVGNLTDLSEGPAPADPEITQENIDNAKRQFEESIDNDINNTENNSESTNEE